MKNVRYFVRSVLPSIFILLCSREVMALTLNVYSDRVAFETVASNLTTFDFNSEPLGIFTSTDFGDFTVSETGPSTQLSILNGGSASPDGTQYLEFRDPRETGKPQMTFTFDSSIAAFGFDYVNTDTSDDFSVLTLDGQTFDVGGPLTSGFFGLIATDGTFTSLTFDDDPLGGGRLEEVNLDNITYTNLTTVPIPAAAWLFGSGLLGLIGIARHKKFA